MKNIVIFILSVFSINLYAQLTDVITGLRSPTSLAIYGNEMYIAEFNAITKINLEDANPVSEVVIAGISGGGPLLIHEDNLYVGLYGNGKVVKLDLTQDNPTPEDVVTGVFGANGLAIKGDYLYVSEATEDKISKVDLTATNPVAIDFITDLGFPNGLIIDENELYFIELERDRIAKVNLLDADPSPSDVVTDLDTPSIGILLIEDELYFSQFGGDKVSKININDAMPLVEDVVTDVNGPAELIQKGDELFIAASRDNKVSKLSNPIRHSLSSVDRVISSNNGINLYPNPTSDMLTILGLKSTQKGILFNGKGAKVMDFVAQENTGLDLQNLDTGIYVVTLENGWTKKVIKK